MNKRMLIHNKLVSIFSALTAGQIYYEPPENSKLTYPCVIYTWTGNENTKADNGIYVSRCSYEVKLVAKHETDTLLDAMKEFENEPYCRLMNLLINDNLKHYTFKILI